jgi:hypothetical protein
MKYSDVIILLRFEDSTTMKLQCGFLVCGAVQSCEWLAIFQKHAASIFRDEVTCTLKTETVYSSETLVRTKSIHIVILIFLF